MAVIETPLLNYSDFSINLKDKQIKYVIAALNSIINLIENNNGRLWANVCKSITSEKSYPHYTLSFNGRKEVENFKIDFYDGDISAFIISSDHTYDAIMAHDIRRQTLNSIRKQINRIFSIYEDIHNAPISEIFGYPFDYIPYDDTAAFDKYDYVLDMTF